MSRRLSNKKLKVFVDADKRGEQVVYVSPSFVVSMASELLTLRAELAALKEAMSDIRDLARTGVALDALSMTQEEWDIHKLNKIARDADNALKPLPARAVINQAISQATGRSDEGRSMNCQCRACRKYREKTLPKEGDLRIWWIPQVPGKPFYVPVASLREAHLILHTLGKYDYFQLYHKIKPDFSNAGGLEEYALDLDGGDPGWGEWENEHGYSIDEVDDEGDALKESPDATDFLDPT